MIILIGLLVLAGGLALYVMGRAQNRPEAKLGLPIAVAGAVVAFVGSAVVVVPAGQTGVVFSAVGGVKPNALGEGVRFVTPMLDSMVLYDARLQELTLAQGERTGDGEGAIRGRSKEGLDITADVTVQFRLKPGAAPELHKELGPNYVRTVVRPQVRSKVRDAIGQFNAADLISSQRQAVEGQVTAELERVFAENNLELQGVLLRELRIPDSVAKAIEEKQTAEQQVAVERNRLQQADIASQRKVVEAEGEAKAAIARAEGEARALSLRGAALKENPQLIQLTVAEKLAPGIQTVMLPSDGNFLLDIKSLAGRAVVPQAAD